VTSENTNPQVWLSETPLLPGERLYLIISAASDAEALKSLYQNEPTTQATPIWGGTPYAAWQPVMPYLIELKPNSSFLTWIADTDAQDWGWMAVSTSTPDVVFEHLRSLTQVRMPDGTQVFFRFWDGRHIYPILEGLGDAAGEVLPVFDRYLINGKSLEVGPRVVPPAKDWPWWEVPQKLLDSLAKQNPSTLIGNLMQWLEEERPDIYAAYPESNLKLKIARFVSRPDAPKNLNEALLNHLILEQG
jgi:hypothetical protein